MTDRGTNPFEDAAAPAAAASSSSNPFDVAVDFDQVQQRRARAREAKQREEERAAAVAADTWKQPILPLADVTDEAYAKPSFPSRAKTTGTDLPTAASAAAAPTKSAFSGIFGFGGRGGDVDHHAVTDDDAADQGLLILPSAGPGRRDVIKAGKKKLAVWPYDDYHLIQKAYYEKMEEQMNASESNNNNAAAKLKNWISGNTHRGMPPQPHQLHSQNPEAAAVVAGQIPMLSRPVDPLDIPRAVQGLRLIEFEAAAEERSIAIVSCWLFDSGLIDELLVNGGMTLALADPFAAPNEEANGNSLSRIEEDKKDSSDPQGEGIEVGRHGQPLDPVGVGSKMDQEISKLRHTTKRQLALINARLNDGVAATGSEVQELVNAVTATKDEIGRLRELTTYVSNASDVDDANQFMLTKYPKLKQAINARRNLARCFRELDFFAQIPSTCDRLRDELHANEWTTHEWSSLRSVCREHVELEIFLVEAEAGMKKRLEEEEAEGINRGGKKSRRLKFGRGGILGGGDSTNPTDDLIDQFLHEQVGNVWELGDEIRMRIMSGIASAFDLAMNNPAGMVALVEAVEVYEQANTEYKAVHGEEAGASSSQHLRFTDMRAAALGELYKDFESRGLDLFRELTSQAADTTDAGDDQMSATKRQFTAVLRAANELTSEIGVVKEQMAPCFPTCWSIETLWTTCVAHLCSSNILQQIGGTDGHKLPDLSVTQLLDLVAWVENFKEIIEETFPNIASATQSSSNQRTHFDEPPKLLVNNNKSVDLDAAQDCLTWVNTVLWDVHDLAKDEFLLRTKEQTEEWLNNVYVYVFPSLFVADRRPGDSHFSAACLLVIS
jgi:hypothetical protein